MSKKKASGTDVGSKPSTRRRGAPPNPPEPERRVPPDEWYDDWFGKVVDRIDRKLGDIVIVNNFDSGDEFEIALCEVLQDLLPERAAVTRGWVVPAVGRKAGDDIIVYDASRFPTLRAQKRDLRRKEHIPADAVLAYIEAKHTLYVNERTPSGREKQSIQKALSQVHNVKSLSRTPVPLSHFSPRFMSWEFNHRRPGTSNIRNPWYAAIWARNISSTKGEPADAELIRQISAHANATGVPRGIPDVVAAGDLFLCPSIRRGDFESGLQNPDAAMIRPFFARDTNYFAATGTKALALGVLHLSYAIEDLILAEIPWPAIMTGHLYRATGGRKDLQGLGLTREENERMDYPLPPGTLPPHPWPRASSEPRTEEDIWRPIPGLEPTPEDG